MGVLCCVTLYPVCELSDHDDVDTAFGHTLIVGVPITLILLSLGHQSITEVRSYDCSNHGYGHVAGVMEADLTLAWPNPHVYGPTKTAVAKARSILATGVHIFGRC